MLVLVALTETLVGPTSSGRGFMEALFGTLPAELPMSELLEGRPRPWFALTSYLLAGLGIVYGARIAARGATSDSRPVPLR